MTLVALLAVTAGAWATDETLLTTITPTGDGTYSETTAGAVTVTPAGSFFYSGSNYGWRWDYYGSLTVKANEGYTITRCVFIQQGKNQSVTISEAPFALNFEEWLCIENYSMDGVTSIEVYGTAPAASSGTTVPLTRGTGEKINEWTLTNGMPAGNVTVSVEYFPQATADGAVTAATDVKATTDAPLVTVDATMLTGATKLMYFVSTSTTAPAYDAEGWTDKVPTAEKFNEAGNVNVWYYPVGTDEGVGGATATYSDGDMNATALAVTLGAAPTYNVTFAKDNPEPDKWSASPNTDVKKGQTVTVTYSGTRKVIGVKAEKKASTPTLKDALKDGATVVITYTWMGGTNVTTFTYTKNGDEYTGSTTGDDAEYFANGMSKDGTTLKFTASNPDHSAANVSIDFDTDTNEYVASKGGYFTSFTISVNGTDVTSQLTEVK